VNKKNTFQKVSAVTSKICFILAIVSAVILYFKVQEYGMKSPISASFLASAFFFIFTGIVLFVVAKADIPSFKIEAKNKL